MMDKKKIASYIENFLNEKSLTNQTELIASLNEAWNGLEGYFKSKAEAILNKESYQHEQRIIKLTHHLFKQNIIGLQKNDGIEQQGKNWQDAYKVVQQNQNLEKILKEALPGYSLTRNIFLLDIMKEKFQARWNEMQSELQPQAIKSFTERFIKYLMRENMQQKTLVEEKDVKKLYCDYIEDGNWSVPFEGYPVSLHELQEKLNAAQEEDRQQEQLNKSQQLPQKQQKIYNRWTKKISSPRKTPGKRQQSK